MDVGKARELALAAALEIRARHVHDDMRLDHLLASSQSIFNWLCGEDFGQSLAVPRHPTRNVAGGSWQDRDVAKAS